MTDLAEMALLVAPKGRLRVALNHGNAVLVARAGDGGASGVSVDLARALADRLGLDIEFLHFERAGEVSGSVGDDIWDICFLAIDPDRAESISFSPPYVAIEGCYALRDSVDASTAAEVDARGLRIGMVEGSAYALYLDRVQGGATLVTFPTLAEAVAALARGDLDGLAGVKQGVARIAREGAGLWVLEDPFMAILQAMGVPAGRREVARFLDGFVAEMKASGFVAEALVRSGHGDVTVPA